MSLGFPLSVGSGNFGFFFFNLGRGKGAVFAVLFAPFLEKGILDYIAHRPIIQVFTVSLMTSDRRRSPRYNQGAL